MLKLGIRKHLRIAIHAHLAAATILALALASAQAQAPQPPVSAGTAAGGTASEGKPPPTPPKIVAVMNEQGETGKDIELSINDDLYIQVAPRRHFDPDGYRLQLNGYEMGLKARYDDVRNAFVFSLERLKEGSAAAEKENKAAWSHILGEPDGWTRQVRLAVFAKGASEPLASEPGATEFNLIVIHKKIFWLSIVAVGVLLWFLYKWAVRTPLLRDRVVDGIPPNQRMFSMGRSQMAFWFVLIVVCFLFIFAVTWDYNSLTSQTLTLMGIAAATALGSVAVDRSKDSPDMKAIRSAEAQLGKAMGLDVPISGIKGLESVDRRIAELEALPPPRSLDQARQLSELSDARTEYNRAIEPYRTKGSWWKDVIEDESGPTIHRFQIFVWTIILGFIFLVEVHRDLAMPTFSETLLALMGISGLTYLGFKLPEK